MFLDFWQHLFYLLFSWCKLKMPRKKSAKNSAPVPPVSSEDSTENESNFTFEEEIAWCTKKLQHLLATKYKDTKDIKAVKPIVIALKTLENKNNPLPKMRLVMRNGCGDYRKEMKEEFEKSKSETKKVDFKEEEEVKGVKVSVKSKQTDKTDVSENNSDPVFSKDVEANVSRLTPFIATSGGNIFTAEEYFVVVDGNVALRTGEFKVAISLCILSFFVFNIKYPEKAALTLEFIQRIFADINPDTGSKAPRVKGKRNNVVAKLVINSVNGLRDFKSYFNL